MIELRGPPENWFAVLWMAVFFLLILVLFAAWAGAAHAEPAAAKQYQRLVTREARAQGGMDAPVAMFAGQIEQESGWNPNAKSPFAEGLAQFTPDTARWISKAYDDLAGPAPFNPGWAVRALIRYDLGLFARYAGSGPNCDGWAFALSAYNGGAGWVARDRDRTREQGGDPSRWFGNTERWSDRGKSAFAENRGYPRSILLSRQYHYQSWGPVVQCPASP